MNREVCVADGLPAASRRRLHPARSACAGGLPPADRCGIRLHRSCVPAGHAVGRDEVACNQPRIQPIAAQLACSSDAHRRRPPGPPGSREAAPRAPGRKLVSGQRLGNHHARIHRMHLDNPLGQIHPDSGNPFMDFSHGCRLMTWEHHRGGSQHLFPGCLRLSHINRPADRSG